MFYARSRIKAGEDWLVLVGDRYGIDLAEVGDEGPHMNTTDTIVDLVCQGVLTEEQGRNGLGAHPRGWTATGLIRKLDEICPVDEAEHEAGEELPLLG